MELTYGTTRILRLSWWKCKLVTSENNFVSFLPIETSILAIQLLGINPRVMKVFAYTGTCMRMF